MGNASYSRHEIVVANLLREQLELFHNIRDTNTRNYVPWDTFLSENVASTTFSSGVYLVENSFSPDSTKATFTQNGNLEKSPVLLRNITETFPLSDTLEKQFVSSALFLDAHQIYTHEKTSTNTPYASDAILSPLVVDGRPVLKDGKNQGYIIDARVIVKNGIKYRMYDSKTLLTDWIK